MIRKLLSNEFRLNFIYPHRNLQDGAFHHDRQLEHPRPADNSLLRRLSLDSLLGILAADWVPPFVYNIGLAGFRVGVLGWVFLGGLVSLEQMGRGAGEHAD